MKPPFPMEQVTKYLCYDFCSRLSRAGFWQGGSSVWLVVQTVPASCDGCSNWILCHFFKTHRMGWFFALFFVRPSWSLGVALHRKSVYSNVVLYSFQRKRHTLPVWYGRLARVRKAKLSSWQDEDKWWWWFLVYLLYHIELLFRPNEKVILYLIVCTKQFVCEQLYIKSLSFSLLILVTKNDTKHKKNI